MHRARHRRRRRVMVMGLGVVVGRNFEDRAGRPHGHAARGFRVCRCHEGGAVAVLLRMTWGRIGVGVRMRLICLRVQNVLVIHGLNVVPRRGSPGAHVVVRVGTVKLVRVHARRVSDTLVLDHGVFAAKAGIR